MYEWKLIKISRLGWHLGKFPRNHKSDRRIINFIVAFQSINHVESPKIYKNSFLTDLTHLASLRVYNLVISGHLLWMRCKTSAISELLWCLNSTDEAIADVTNNMIAQANILKRFEGSLLHQQQPIVDWMNVNGFFVLLLLRVTSVAHFFFFFFAFS